MKRLVIFDLDGTLLNTIADLAQSTNYALTQLGYPTHPQEAYPLMVGNGINKLLERALPEKERTDENVRRMREAFVPYYDVHNTEWSIPYPGIPELLSGLHRQGTLLAVASNKYQEATEKLVRYYFPAIPFQMVLGQRKGVPVKPDPAIVHEILDHTQIASEEVLYIGDSGVDMQTALNSGVTVCGVTWGFRPRAELESFHPHHMVERAADILPLTRL
ncbi:MAG: HAD family hydrolase [Bacteroides sp.]|nr:HAD family hydrolase [Bacteroides sp.]